MTAHAPQRRAAPTEPLRCPICNGRGVISRERLQDAIRSHIRLDGECWIWTGSLNTEEYGQITLDRVKWLAHRMAHEAFIGPIPDGKDVLHSCDRKPCVNPLHLRAGTADDNNKDRRARALVYGRAGAANHFAKLTIEQVERIRAAVDDEGILRRHVALGLAAECGVSLQTIYRVANGKTWREDTRTTPEPLPHWHTRTKMQRAK